MTDAKQPEALRLADELEREKWHVPAVVMQAAAEELRRQHAELETLRAKLKVYEDLSDAADDVQLLRMGYAAARLEIESLKAQSAGAQPAAQPSYEHQRAIMEGERNASLDAYSRVVSITSAESRLYERAFTSGWDRRDRLASYGQAPAQAAPAAVAGPSAITASIMRDDGGEQPAFCLMVAYRSEKDARAALAMIAAPPEGMVASGSLDHLKLMMEHSAFAGALQLDDALANIDEFARASLSANAVAQTPAHIEAMERAWLWMENQADNQSKGGHATFDLMMLREERDALRAAIDAAPTTQPAPQQEAQEPVAGHCRFPGGAWAECSPEHVRMVRANPEEWKGYEVRYLYAEPQPSPAAQEDAFKLLDEVAQCFTTDDGLPDNLLPRIDAVIAARAAQEGK